DWIGDAEQVQVDAVRAANGSGQPPQSVPRDLVVDDDQVRLLVAPGEQFDLRGPPGVPASHQSWGPAAAPGCIIQQAGGTGQAHHGEQEIHRLVGDGAIHVNGPVRTLERRGRYLEVGRGVLAECGGTMGVRPAVDVVDDSYGVHPDGAAVLAAGSRLAPRVDFSCLLRSTTKDSSTANCLATRSIE